MNTVPADQLIDAPVPSSDPVDSVRRILNYLDSGGVLGKNALRREDNFCILGLFADEYPGGSWSLAEGESGGVYAFTDAQGLSDDAVLTSAVVDYYGLTGSRGNFLFDALPLEIKQLCLINTNKAGASTISSLNDYLVATECPDTNKILAGIIRSGAIFNDPSQYQKLT